MAWGGRHMPKYMITGAYSSGSWARMLHSPGDRTAAVKAVADAVGGTIEAMYWNLETRSAIIITDLPDTVTAAGVVTVGTKTGAFTSVQAQELLNQDQLSDWLVVARDMSEVYETPGQSG